MASDMFPRPPKATIISLALVFIFVVVYYLPYHTTEIDNLSGLLLDEKWGFFESISLPGFVNSGSLQARSCADLRYEGTIGVQKSILVHDDLEQIALSLEHSPIVAYSELTLSNLPFSDIVSRQWARLSGSAVWLADQGVFLVVTRVLFLGDNENLSEPRASFLRGQLFDEEWKHLANQSLDWNGNVLTFPLIFEVPTTYEGGEHQCCYGPEDPRIILKDGGLGAEPVIVFNMVDERSGWRRAMYVFRPFSNQTTMLSILDTAPQHVEKNWTPFFVSDYPATPYTSDYIHFVYTLKPLTILKCHLGSGDCEIVFQQQLPSDSESLHHEGDSSLHGGTNLVPLPIPSSAGVHAGVRAYIGFPRTRVTEPCGWRGPTAFFRPEFIVMVAFRDNFHLAYASEALDFGDVFIDMTPEDDVCDKGRILIANSISSWDTEQDVMTITGSVDDTTVQVARLHGLLAFVRRLPQWRGMFRRGGPLDNGNGDEVTQLASWVGDDVRACAVESALNYTLAITQTHG